MKINFPRLVCPDCQSKEQYTAKKGDRFGIYCDSCGRFLKWADENEKIVINARSAWLKEHDKEAENV